jgi:hypothetical protein
MKTIEQIYEKIAEIESDSRYQSGLKKPATIDINAPLAMIQLSFEVQMSILKWVLDE